MLKSTLILVACLASTLALAPRLAFAEQGVTDKAITIGSSAPLSGPAESYGTELRRGAKVFWNKVNAAGGIHGRKIQLIFLDDAFDGEKSRLNHKQLVETDKVFAVVSSLGTQGMMASRPIFVQTGVPMLGAITGAQFLREPVVKNIFNVRPSYFDEADQMVSLVVDKLKINEIGIFRDDTGLGQTGKQSLQKALHKRGLKLYGEGVYTTNTTEVSQAVADLAAAKPKVVMLWGTYKQCAAFVTEANKIGFKPVVFASDPVITGAFFDLADKGAVSNMYFMSAVPLMRDTTYGIVKQYQQDMKAAGHAKFDPYSLEGYINAAIFAEALKKAGKNLTRQALIEALESTESEIGGLKYSFNATEHQGFKKAFVAEVKDGKIIPFKE